MVAVISKVAISLIWGVRLALQSSDTVRTFVRGIDWGLGAEGDGETLNLSW